MPFSEPRAPPFVLHDASIETKRSNRAILAIFRQQMALRSNFKIKDIESLRAHGLRGLGGANAHHLYCSSVPQRRKEEVLATVAALNDGAVEEVGAAGAAFCTRCPQMDFR